MIDGLLANEVCEQMVKEFPEMKTKLNIIIMSMNDRHMDISTKPPTWKSSEPLKIFEKREKKLKKQGNKRYYHNVCVAQAGLSHCAQVILLHLPPEEQGIVEFTFPSSRMKFSAVI